MSKYIEDLHNKVILGDSLKLIKEIPDNSIDLVVLDPPYSLTNTNPGDNSEFSRSLYGVNNDLINEELDRDIGFEWCKEIPRIQEKINCYIWCNKAQIKQYLDYFIDNLECSWDLIVWRKSNAIPTFNNKLLTDKEYCLYFRKGGYCKPVNYWNARTVWDLPINILDKKRYSHPTIKPIEMINAFIENSSKPNDLVLDFFAGSGTTGECAYNLGRKFILIEKNEKHYKTAQKRVDMAMGEIVVESEIEEQISIL